MNGDEWTGVIFGMGVLTLGTIILVVVLVQVGPLLRARTEKKADSRYAELVQRYEQLATDLETQQRTTAEGVDELRTRTVEIERILRDVG